MTNYTNKDYILDEVLLKLLCSQDILDEYDATLNRARRLFIDWQYNVGDFVEEFWDYGDPY